MKWTTSKGKEIEVKDLQEDHLNNIIKKLKREDMDLICKINKLLECHFDKEEISKIVLFCFRYELLKDFQRIELYKELLDQQKQRDIVNSNSGSNSCNEQMLDEPGFVNLSDLAKQQSFSSCCDLPIKEDLDELRKVVYFKL